MYDDLMRRKKRHVLGFKVKSQLSVWMTYVVECIEGFCKKVKSQLSAWTTSTAKCAEGDWKKGSATKCAVLDC